MVVDLVPLLFWQFSAFASPYLVPAWFFEPSGHWAATLCIQVILVDASLRKLTLYSNKREEDNWTDSGQVHYKVTQRPTVFSWNKKYFTLKLLLQIVHLCSLDRLSPSSALHPLPFRLRTIRSQPEAQERPATTRPLPLNWPTGWDSAPRRHLGSLGGSRTKRTIKMPRHYYDGCLCGQVRSNRSGTAFLLVLARALSRETIPNVPARAATVTWSTTVPSAYLPAWWMTGWYGVLSTWSSFPLRSSLSISNVLPSVLFLVSFFIRIRHGDTALSGRCSHITDKQPLQAGSITPLGIIWCPNSRNLAVNTKRGLRPVLVVLEAGSFFVESELAE